MDIIEYEENQLLNDYYDEQDRGESDEEENEELSYEDQKAVSQMLYENRY